MSIVTNLSLKVRITALVALLLIAAIGITSWVGHVRYKAAYFNTVDETGNVALRGLTTYLTQRYDNMSYEIDHTGHLQSLVWPGLTPFLQDDAADAIQGIHEIDSTIFSYDRVSEEFTRVATTIRGEDGTRLIGTTLARGTVYDALLAGELYHGDADVLGEPFRTHYVPVYGLDGNLVGSIASALPLEAVLARLDDSVMEKVTISSGVLALLLVVTFGSTYILFKPFRRITQSVVSLSNGKLDDEIGYESRSDEVGKIAQSLTVLQDSMRQAEQLRTADAERVNRDAQKAKEQAIVVDALSDGLARLGKLDLTAQIQNTTDAPFPADYEELRTSFNMLVDNLSESLEAIRDVATEVSNDAKEMADASGDLSSRTENQAATLEESAAALEEMSASVQSTAANASEAESNTQENRTNAKRTGEIVDTAIEAMAAIEDSSQKITQIISVIDDIAFQTNLLALNAGVEAARAGEAGRGFAVVASEVRALAQHSSSSAQEIKTLIASSSGHVENGSKLVRKAGESIGDIIDRVDRVSGLVSDIAISAKEQSIGVTEINAAVRDLDAATQGNAAMAEETTAASEGLTSAAERLTNHLAKFKLAGAPSSNWAEAAASVSTVNGAGHMDDADAFASIPARTTSAQGEALAQVNAFQDF